MIYTHDDKTSEPIADLLVRKGFQNVAILTGGISKVYLKEPELIEGEIPNDFVGQIDPDLISMCQLTDKTGNTAKALSVTSLFTMKTKKNKVKIWGCLL